MRAAPRRPLRTDPAGVPIGASASTMLVAIRTELDQWRQLTLSTDYAQ